MLTPKVKAKEFAKYGFKRCKGIPRDSECYYLCVARGCKMIFVKPELKETIKIKKPNLK